MPNQRLREVRAFGKAYANSIPDTTRIISSERDWMRGETVIAEFDSIPAADTTSKPKPRVIVATGDASSFYQLAGSGNARGAPNLNYVRGRVITVTFAEGSVARVDVTDQASGVYLEPTTGASTAVTPPGTGVRPRPGAGATPPPPPSGPRRE